MRNHFQWSEILPGLLKIYCALPLTFSGPVGIHSALTEIYWESPGIYPAPVEIYWGPHGIHSALPEIYWESPGIYSASLEIYWGPPEIYSAPVMNEFLPVVSDFNTEVNEINQKFLRGGLNQWVSGLVGQLLSSMIGKRCYDSLVMMPRPKPETNENQHKRLAQHIGSPCHGAPGRRRQKDFTPEVNQFKHKNKQKIKMVHRLHRLHRLTQIIKIKKIRVNSCFTVIRGLKNNKRRKQT